MDNILVGNISLNGASVELCAGENVKVQVDPETKQIFISAPAINLTRIKNGPFSIMGEQVIIEAGKNIVINTIHPNKMVIGADISKEQLKILNLESRIENLEKVIATLLKDKKNDIR
jgi:hypothetical protein